ncbi:MAG: hypothetical protein QF441_10900 [Bacteriovoracaceae bacterium]|jgi:hypothetical protein|nr:hypothetical protein [Bacteriovoracaceae bacterium]
MKYFVMVLMSIIIGEASLSSVYAQEKLQKSNEESILVSKNSAEEKVEDEVSTTNAAVDKLQGNLGSQQLLYARKKISQYLSGGFDTDLKETTNNEKGYSSYLSYSLTYKLNTQYSTRIRTSVSKDLSTSFEEELGDTGLTLSKSPMQLAKNLLFIPSVTAVLPTSEKSKRNQELILGTYISPVLIYNFTDFLSFTYLPRARKNFHEYTTSRTNRTNTEYSLAQYYILGYSISDRWGIESTFLYGNSWSYSGRRRDPSYRSIIELGYYPSRKISLAVGTVQGGSIYDREQGPNQQVEILNKDETTVYGSFALKF